MSKCVIVYSKDWFKRQPKSKQFKKLNLIEITSKKKLNIKNLKKINPKYIFFIHWNSKVNYKIYEKFNCVVFHTAPLPYGRGGSPIQNLIIRKIKKTPVCALKMTEVLDGGPIYDSLEITLDGDIKQIFSRIARCIEKLIIKIYKKNLIPIPQKGKIVSFKRLSYADNELLASYSVREMYDRIRMVDGEGYKKAYIKLGHYNIEFSNSQIVNEELLAKVRIYKNAD